MSNIWVREFTGGLDTRRMPETTPGGSLIKAQDAHINRGGEVEKRAAFVPSYSLPEGTVGLAAGSTGLYVFGHTAAPAGMPANVAYQRLVHPVTSSLEITRILSAELYAGKLYVVAEFEDGRRFHYYDGARVRDFFDGRASAQFTVTDGAVNEATSAEGGFTVTGGSDASGVNRITGVTVDGVSVISGVVTHTGDNETTALAVANAINAHTSTPDYTASNDGADVVIKAVTAGSASNGYTVAVTVSGDVTVGDIEDMAGGMDASTSSVSDIQVNSVSIIGNSVLWAESNSETAARIANAINSFTSSPNYEAAFDGATVSIVAEDTGTGPNGYSVDITTVDGMAVSPSSGITMAGGADEDPDYPPVAASGSFEITGGSSGTISDVVIDGVSLIASAVAWNTSDAQTATDVAAAITAHTSDPNYTASATDETVTITAADTGATINGEAIVVTVTGDVTVDNETSMSGGDDGGALFIPGTFVKTVGSRMTTVANSLTHGSGLSTPTGWETDVTGAFFIDMSTRSSGAEKLNSIALYQRYVAVFADRVIQIWFFESDPNNNEIIQVLNNTGTSAPKSVTQFGDEDLFYVDESGLRSLRARDSSNAAATTDIGVPIDTLVTAKLRATTDKTKVIGVIEPRDGRFWLAMEDTIYVFSYFPGSKVSAWSTYTATTNDGSGAEEFTIDDMVVFNKRVYIRSGDTIYAYGGLGSDYAYDSTEPEIHMPFLDGGDPTIPKVFKSFDVAAQGLWEVNIALDPTEPDETEPTVRVTQTTYALQDKVPFEARSTHISPRFKAKGDGAAKLSSFAITYDSAAGAADAG